jgi:peptidoglycan hydrolase CwlO-like protein
MASIITILAQTVAGTIVEIVVLLLVAGLIGYFTSYYYYRGIYRKKIYKLESDLKDVQIKNGDLQDQIDRLQKELEEEKARGTAEE